MKKKVIAWLCVALVLLLIIGGIRTILFPWVLPHQVQRVVLRGHSSCCGGSSSERVELTRSEINQLLLWYNLAAYDGLAEADPCESDYGFYIYLSDGDTFSIWETNFNSAQIEANHPGKDRAFWLQSVLFDRFALNLLEKYDLTHS